MIAFLALAAALPTGLVDALMREKRVAECVRTQSEYADPVLPASQYLARSFDVQKVTLKSGEEITVLVGSSACLQQGTAAVAYAYERTGDRFRQVLDEYSIPGDWSVSPDGTLVLPAHESVVTIVNQTFVWNGSKYVVSPLRSTVWNVCFGESVPYETQVRFQPGTSSAVLAGAYGRDFDRTYVFDVRKGQHIEVTLLSYGGDPPEISVSLGDTNLGDVKGGRWSGVAPRDGTYSLDVDGSEKAHDLHNFRVRLSIWYEKPIK